MLSMTIEKLEELVRDGKFDEVELYLRKLSKIERKCAVHIANIARRINRPGIAIKILHPIVRSEDKLKEAASFSEKIEYAEALRRVGAVDEAWALLNEVDEDEVPQAQLYKIFCLFNQWKYEEALPLLRKYIATQTLTPYARLVGKINFAAALIHSEHLLEAADLLTSLQQETRASKTMLLYGNSLELTAQLLILQKKYTEAIEVLKEAQTVLKDAGKFTELFIIKWTAIAKSMVDARPTDELVQVFEQAKTEKHWETVRDCDLYISLLTKDTSRLSRLYFGTPYNSFRLRILKLISPAWSPPASYLSSLTPSPATTFDVSTGIVRGRLKGQLPVGHAMHRFFILVTQDFYRPVSVLSAFGKLFPGEHMAANSSSNRVHQIVRRCREWIDEVGLDLELLETDGSYHVQTGRGTGLIIPQVPLPLHDRELQWIYFRTISKNRTFKVHQLAEALECSAASAQRFLKWAIETNHVRKIGKGPMTKYVVAQDSTSIPEQEME